jgi:hypothetical protein
MQVSKLCVLAALAAACSANAANAAATQVNITDPNAATRAAHVEPGNRLAVQEVPPTNFYHNSNFGLNAGSGCQQIAIPPAGKALVIQDVRINVYADPSPGLGQFVYLSLGFDCSSASVVGDLDPPTVGQTVVPFGSGLTIPASSALSILVGGSVATEAYVDGYTVPTAVAPTAGQTVQVHGRSSQLP